MNDGDINRIEIFSGVTLTGFNWISLSDSLLVSFVSYPVSFKFATDGGVTESDCGGWCQRTVHPHDRFYNLSVAYRRVFMFME